MADFADPIGGFASIKGLDIRTDSITDRRWDRVMPILAEEQVLMCHQMLNTVHALRQRRGRALRILDLGCGSGVFGIFLDRELNRDARRKALPKDEQSSILCLDINPRAIRFVRDNAARNSSANVNTQCEPYGTSSVQPESQDIIVINPPYHPVSSHWIQDVSLHGAAGDDGLAVFRAWKEDIAHHLACGGKLIGSVMSPVCADGGIVAMQELQETLGRGTSSIRYCRHLDEPDPTVRAFIEGVYAEYLSDEPELMDWIANLEERFTHFTVVYFEAEKAAEQNTGIYDDIPRHQDDSGVTWKDRIHIHALMARQTSRQSPGEIS